MGMKLIMNGKGIISAFERGVIPALMDSGLELQDAQAAAVAVEVREIDNLIVNTGLYFVADLLLGDEVTGFTHFALGTTAGTPIIAGTILDDEVARKAITSLSRSNEVITLSTFFTAAEATYEIEECGVFGGTAAGTALNSGVMFSHYLQSYDNGGGNFDLTFDYILTLGTA